MDGILIEQITTYIEFPETYLIAFLKALNAKYIPKAAKTTVTA